MADGTTKPISEVEVGDEVLTYDPETGERGPRKVTDLWVHQDTLVDLEIGGSLIATTEDHPFWNETERRWQRADATDRVSVLMLRIQLRVSAQDSCICKIPLVESISTTSKRLSLRDYRSLWRSRSPATQRSRGPSRRVRLIWGLDDRGA